MLPTHRSRNRSRKPENGRAPMKPGRPLAFEQGRKRVIGRPGLEHSQDSGENKGLSEAGGSKSGNKGERIGDSVGVIKPADPALAAVVAAWPTLPAAIKAAMLALVNAGDKP